MPHDDKLGHGRELVSRLPSGSVRGVEVGVAAGDLSRFLLESRPDLSLMMVDPWLVEPSAGYREWCRRYGDPSGFRTSLAMELDYAAAVKVARDFSDRAVLIRATSREASIEVAPRSLDFAFIDGDHREDSCFDDLLIWGAKVKPGGLLCGHDFDRPCFDGGVRRAVEKFQRFMGRAASRSPRVEVGADWTWFMEIPATEGGRQSLQHTEVSCGD